MCGIAGIIRWNGSEQLRGEIEGMTAAVAHRGPDGAGVLVRDPVALGHRRLAIIDLETGGQPMTDDSGLLAITHNGEIYNYRELRAQLEAAGHRFRTHSDTEVVLHAYREWGDACVLRFRGMFAFAIADFGSRRLFMARDHFGIKPVYWRAGDGFFAFASELPSLCRIRGPFPDGSIIALEHYLRFHYIPAPRTIFHDVFKLAPGTSMVVDFEGRRSTPCRYWDLNFDEGERGPVSDWATLVDEAIRDSVSAHLVADVPFGVLLSGGIDSTTVTARAASLTDTPLQAFAIGFADVSSSELSYARAAARRCGVDLVTDVVNDEVIDFVSDLLQHHGEPFGDSSLMAMSVVSRLARQAVPMVLSGDGGDEAFGGYEKYVSWLRFVSPQRGLLQEPLRTTASRWRWLAKSGRGNTGGWKFLIAQSSDRRRRGLWHRPYGALVDVPCEAVEYAEQRADGWSRLSYAQYLDYHTYLPSILAKVDMAAMVHGLEVRTPFVDRDLLAVAAALPEALRIREIGGTPVTKAVLKDLLQPDFGPDFIHRRKQGFELPLGTWFSPGHKARSRLESALLGSSRLTDFFRPAALKAELREFDQDRGSSARLWALFALSSWLDANRAVSFT